MDEWISTLTGFPDLGEVVLVTADIPGFRHGVIAQYAYEDCFGQPGPFWVIPPSGVPLLHAEDASHWMRFKESPYEPIQSPSGIIEEAECQSEAGG